MRSLLTAGLLAGFALASPALAQDKAYDASTVVATVNGTDITLGHVIAMRDRLPPQYQNLPDDVLMNGLVDQLVDQELLAEAQSSSPETDPAAGQAGRRERAPRRAGRHSPPTPRSPKRWTTPKVQAAYDAQVAGFTPAPEFNAAHILVDSEDKAKALKAEIDGGKDFAEVAKANSSDGSAANGGELGWFGMGQMVPEFETAVVAMPVGAVSEPVKIAVRLAPDQAEREARDDPAGA